MTVSSETLAPAPAPAVAGPRSQRRRAWAVVAVVAVALGFLLYKGLDGATEYFLTVDQAVAQHQSLGSQQFRLEGTVGDSITHQGASISFDVTNNGASAPVVYTGDTPELFKPGIPVVLDGHFSGSTFTSNLIMVKHSSVYVAQHPDRVKNYVGKK